MKAATIDTWVKVGLIAILGYWLYENVLKGLPSYIQQHTPQSLGG